MYKVSDSLVERIEKQRKIDQRFLKTIAIILMFISIIIVINTHVFLRVVVDGYSMYPTMKTGDVLTANRFVTPKRGDIVVIDKGDKLVIKRVIALELDVVEINDGIVKVNGKVLDEDYVVEGYTDPEDDYPKTHVPRGHIFYLGDNRGNSLDSRTTGTCPIDQVVGVVTPFSMSMRGVSNFFYEIGNFFRGGA